MGQPRLRTEESPDSDGDDGGYNDGRDKVRRNCIGEPLNGGAAALSFAHHPHNLRKQCFAADALRLHYEAACSIHGAGCNSVTPDFLHWNRLTGDHRFINRACTFQDHSIHWNLFSWTNAEPVAGLDEIERYLFLAAVLANDSCCFWRQSEKRPDCAAGMATRAEFENLP